MLLGVTDSKIEKALKYARDDKGDLVAADKKTSEDTENTDESLDVSTEEPIETSDESTEADPVLIEGEAVELENSDDFDDVIDTSDDVAENFPPAATVAEPPKRASIWPMFFGGLIAVGLGFGGAYYWLQDRFQALTGVDTNASGIAQLTTQVEELGASIPTLPPAVDTSGIEASIETLQGTITAMSDDVSAMQTDILALQDVPPADLSEVTTGLRSLADRVGALEIEEGNAQSAQADEAAAQLTAFKAELETLVSDAESKVATAEANLVAAQTKAAEADVAAAEVAEKAATQAKIAELKTAVEGGSPFDALIADMPDVPADLVDYADRGVPTLNVLQQEFASAARAALGAVQTIPEDASAGDKLTAFLRRQTNARSLGPKDGDDADAVLSRAEASLAKGDLTAALSEVSALPEAAQSAMSGWLTNAEIRQSALTSINALSEQMN